MGQEEGATPERRGPRPHGTVTLGDVARRVGLSAQSVSNALNTPERVAPATRDRILAAVAELGYRPNRSARTLRNRSSHLIGVKIEATPGNRASPLLDEFLHALTESAAAADCHLILCHAQDEAAEIAAYHELLQTTAVDAIVLTGTHRHDARVAALREWQVPFAAFGRSWDGEDLPWVDVDGRAGLRLATDHLAGLGHERVAHLGWPASEVGQDRRQGWLDGCAAAGLEPAGEETCEDDFEAARRAAHRLLDQPASPTARPSGHPSAVVCASDTLALGVLRALDERGLRAGAEPGQVAVTGFDNSPAAALVTPGLTSLRQPVARVAHELIDIVDRLVTGRGGTPSHTLLTPDLVVRGSSAARSTTPTVVEDS